MAGGHATEAPDTDSIRGWELGLSAPLGRGPHSDKVGLSGLGSVIVSKEIAEERNGQLKDGSESSV